MTIQQHVSPAPRRLVLAPVISSENLIYSVEADVFDGDAMLSRRTERLSP